MNRPTQLLLLLAVLAVAGVLAHSLSTGPADLPPATDPATDPATPADPDTGRLIGRPQVRDHVLRGKDREIATDPDRRIEVRPDLSGSDLPQGVKGVVADPQGYPLANATVYLMPALGSNAFDLLEKKRQGMRFLPVAQTHTRRDGRFALGLEWRGENHRFEIRIVHDSFCERSLPSLQVQERDWYNAGTIRLKRGTAVRGRVTTKAGGFPIADALITISNPNGVLRLAGTPGQTEGLTAHTGADGRYRIPNVDPRKSYRVSAVAADFARQQHSNVTLDPHGDSQVDFQLGRGWQITGLVTGPAGEPLSHAKVTAHALTQKSPQTEETRADDHGRFVLMGLDQGSFTVIAEAYGYIRGEDAPIPAGKRDLHIVLEKQGMVIVQAFDKHGRPLHDYTIHLRTWFEGSPMPGHTKVYKHVRGTQNGVATLDGLDPMDYVVEVQAKDHAKAFSPPFRIVASPRTTPRVTVRLGEGGVLAGVVLDERGNPLPGVAIQTLPNQFVDNIFIRMLGAQIPHRITKTKVVTNEQGEFRIPLLNDGKYQLQFTYRDYTNLFTKGHEVWTGQTSALGTIRMVRGALVDGIARLNGVARGQIKITVTRVASTNAEESPPFTCETVSGNNGHFVLPKQLPPGKYQVRGADLLADVFTQMIQFQKSLVKFGIGKGQIRHQLQVRIPVGAK